MWPWEHVAFAYLLYSPALHVARGRSPGDVAAVALGLGALVPDLVDKPLAWAFGVFQTGYGAAHSVLVVVPLLFVLVAAARRYDRAGPAVAYAAGHLSHLAGDLVYPFVAGAGVPVERLLWPVSTFPEAGPSPGFVTLVTHYLREYAARVLALDVGPLLLFEATLLGAVLVLWLFDGAPGTRALRRRLARRDP
jgi:hypothetical protein